MPKSLPNFVFVSFRVRKVILYTVVFSLLLSNVTRMWHVTFYIQKFYFHHFPCHSYFNHFFLFLFLYWIFSWCLTYAICLIGQLIPRLSVPILVRIFFQNDKKTKIIYLAKYAWKQNKLWKVFNSRKMKNRRKKWIRPGNVYLDECLIL